MNTLELTGLTARPSQAWGGIQLVPLVRERPVEGLRLHHEVHAGGGSGVVEARPRTHRTSSIPHGFVADWSGEGAGTATYGTQPAAHGDAGRTPPRTVRLPRHRHHRTAKRQPGDRLRFLPLHLALEGYLSLHFGGPSTAWEEWSRHALRDGLSPRAEDAYLGWSVRGLGDALRVFEIHPGKCGVMVYAADALAAAFVVPRPEDYRLLHASLVQDLYGELVHQYTMYGAPVPAFGARIADGPGVDTLAGLRAAAREQERAWRGAHGTLFARELLDSSYGFERVYRMGAFTLWRFLPGTSRVRRWRWARPRRSWCGGSGRPASSRCSGPAAEGARGASQPSRLVRETSVTRGSHESNGREIASCEAALHRPAAPPKDGFRDVQG